MTDCLFCAIAAGDKPAFVVHSGEHVLAFLDLRPVFKGHLLVIPRSHVPTLTDLDPVAGYFEHVKAAARAVEEGLAAAGTFVAINNKISQSVPHLHTHVVPRVKGDGLRGFFWPRTKYASDDEAASFASRVAAAWH
ncbi:MAG TPA: HIT family protein [Candidatus Limnocylindrales bacterium]|nr:HIT family protein [Candidatus Limnocylindrales bacterium]